MENSDLIELFYFNIGSLDFYILKKQEKLLDWSEEQTPWLCLPFCIDLKLGEYPYTSPILLHNVIVTEVFFLLISNECVMSMCVFRQQWWVNRPWSTSPHHPARPRVTRRPCTEPPRWGTVRPWLLWFRGAVLWTCRTGWVLTELCHTHTPTGTLMCVWCNTVCDVCLRRATRRCTRCPGTVSLTASNCWWRQELMFMSGTR